MKREVEELRQKIQELETELDRCRKFNRKLINLNSMNAVRLKREGIKPYWLKDLEEAE